MSQLTPEIPFMASLWIRSGCDMKVEVSAETYQVGAHFEALIKAILVIPSRIPTNFFISGLPAAMSNLTHPIHYQQCLEKWHCLYGMAHNRVGAGGINQVKHALFARITHTHGFPLFVFIIFHVENWAEKNNKRFQFSKWRHRRISSF